MNAHVYIYAGISQIHESLEARSSDAAVLQDKVHARARAHTRAPDEHSRQRAAAAAAQPEAPGAGPWGAPGVGLGLRAYGAPVVTF